MTLYVDVTPGIGLTPVVSM